MDKARAFHRLNATPKTDGSIRNILFNPDADEAPDVQLNEQDYEKFHQRGYIDTIFYLPVRGYKACWPYVVFCGIKGYIWLTNAYN